MAYVYIPFLEYWAGKMLGDVKTCTSRVRQYGKVGDYFKLFGATFEMTKIEKVRLDAVANKYHAQEGCDTPEKFMQIWANIHPKKGFVAEQEVFVHHFKKIA